MNDALLSPRLRRVAGIPGLDWRAGLANIAGLQEEYKELLELIAGMIPDLSNKITASAASGDLPELAVHVHSAKGSLANVGGSELSGRAAELEKAAKEGDSAFVTTNLERFLADLRRFGEEVTAALSEDATATATTTAEPEKRPEAGELPAGVADELRRALDEFDFNAAKAAIAGLRERNFGDGLNARIAEIAALVDDLEYDEALEKLDGLS